MPRGCDSQDNRSCDTKSVPLIAVTPWRRTLPTVVHPETDLYTIASFYTDAIAAAGGHAVLTPFAPDQAAAEAIISRVDGLVLSGGGDMDPSFYNADNTASIQPNPTADQSDLAFLQAARERRKPVLAICRGLQVVNVSHGGTLHQDIWGSSPQHPAQPTTGDPIADADAFLDNRHRVTLTEGSTMASLFQSATVETNSLHHQSIDQIGHGLVAVGHADDGVVEAIEDESGEVLGVQWHPERLANAGHHVLFDWLIERAAA